MKLPQEPDACAVLAGNENYPDLQGTVKFYDTYGGSSHGVLLVFFLDSYVHQGCAL